MRVTRLEHCEMEAYIFDCPGCGDTHMLPVSYSPEYARRRKDAGIANPAWTFNGDLDRPTFSPSLLVRGVYELTDDEHKLIMAGNKIAARSFVCHSYVRDGKIEFLNDCTHALKGKTVDLPEATDA